MKFVDTDSGIVPIAQTNASPIAGKDRLRCQRGDFSGAAGQQHRVARGERCRRGGAASGRRGDSRADDYRLGTAPSRRARADRRRAPC